MVRHLRAVKEMIVSTSEGKDIIFGFDKNDTLTLDNLTFTSTTYSKSKSTVTLKFDTGSITFKDYTATTFHINDDTYKISGAKLVKKHYKNSKVSHSFRRGFFVHNCKQLSMLASTF